MVLFELSMGGRLHSIVTNVDLALHNGRQFSIPCIEHGERAKRGLSSGSSGHFPRQRCDRDLSRLWPRACDMHVIDGLIVVLRP